MEKRDIAITIQNFVQFYSIKNGIDELIKRKYSVDLYIPKCNDDTGFGNLFDETYNKLIKSNYSIKRYADSKIMYKVLLEPYPMEFFLKFKYEYRIKYKYSLLSAKPNLVYKPESNIYYDCILCFSKYDANFLKAYSNTELIGNLKYIDYKKEKLNVGKPVLLYLPTYGEESSIDSIVDELKLLKEEYYIITKFHHGTTCLKDEADRIQQLKKVSDECYNHTTELVELLSKVDVVLSDNSGSIFETLYAKVPLAIYSKDINRNKLGNLDTIQFNLVREGYIPYTNNVDEISNKLKEALSDEYISKQNKLSDELFYRPKEPVKEFANIIEKFLNDNIDVNYKCIHDILIKDYNEKSKNMNEMQGLLNENNILKQELKDKLKEQHSKEQDLKNMIEDKNSEINNLKEINRSNEQSIKNYEVEIESKNRIIGYYENGKLYKICKKIYKLYYKMLRKE